MIQISANDYYKFNAPFRLWLSEVKGKQLGDYKTVEAKLIFATEFVLDWNESLLSEVVYLKGPEIKQKDIKTISSSNASCVPPPSAMPSPIRAGSPMVTRNQRLRHWRWRQRQLHRHPLHVP